MDALEPHVREAACVGVEACCKRNNINGEFAPVCRANTRLSKFLDCISTFLGYVDEMYVWLVQDFKVFLLETGSLDSEWVGWLFGEEECSFDGVSHCASHIMLVENSFSLRYMIEMSHLPRGDCFLRQKLYTSLLASGLKR